jgi:hypothetical protein
MNLPYSVVAAKIPKSQAPKQLVANKLTSDIQSINRPSTLETPIQNQPTRGERGVAETSYLSNSIV